MSAVATAEAAAGSDTLRDSLAAKGNPLAALILSKDDPQRARRKTAYAARNTAEVCGRCGRALKPDEPVWREQCAREPGYFGGTTSILAPVCDACHSQYQRFWHEHPCGHCGRRRRQRLDRVRADIKALAERLEAAIARQGS